jgi:hypothetical protein
LGGVAIKSKQHPDAASEAGGDVSGRIVGAGYDFACLPRRPGIGGQTPVSG